MPQTQKKQDMGTGDVKKLLLQLMIPAVVAQVVNLLYNIVDRIYIGHIEGIGAAALPKLVEAVLANQTIGVDSVAGATVTSEAFKAAMTDALTQAGADMDKMTAAVAASELEDVQMDADVVVVGAGGAGIAAAAQAAQDGNTVLVIEHNLDVIKVADHIIDLGPEGGDGGGAVVFAGTPEDCANCAESATGEYLKKVLA